MKKKYNDGLGPVTKQVLSSFGKRAKSIAKKAAKPLAMAAIFAAAIYAAGRRAKKLTEKYSFRNRVIRGEITEQDAVRDISYHITDELEEQLNVKFNLIWDPDEELNDEEKKKYYEEKKKLDVLIKRIRNARTFAELRKYADSQWIDDIENEYKSAVKERKEMIKKGTKTMKKTDRAIRRYHIDGFSLGEKLKSAWNKLQPEDKAATISILSGAVISGVVILANYLIDRRTIKDIQLGVITEKDLVRKVADKILLGLENSYMNYETAMTIVPIIKGIKNAKSFDELRKYFSSSELDKAERLYRRAMATKKKDSSRITMHDSMPWVKKSRNDSLKRYNDIDLKSVVDKIKQQIAKIKQGLVDWGKDHPKAAFRIKRILKILAAIGVDIAASKFANNGGKTNADYNKIEGMKRELENGIIDLEKMDDGSYGVPEMPNELKMWLRILVGLLGKFVVIGLAVSAIRQKKTDSIRRHTDFDLKSKVSQLKAYFVKVKKDLEEWGERNPATKLAIKNMARAVSVAISIAAGRSFTKDLKTLEHLRDNVKNDYIELIQQRDGSFGLPAVPSKIKMGLKLFVSALSGIITILINKSYTREERTANVINSFFNL